MRSKKNKNWSFFSEKFEDIFQNNLIQIALYNQQYSSGEIVIILEDDSIPQIASAYSIINTIQKKNMSIPVFLSKNFIEQSLNDFPLEFLHIQTGYQNLFCRNDLLKSLVFDNKTLIRQMIRELNSKSLHLKMNFLELYGNISKLEDLIRISILSIIPILIGFLKINEISSSILIENDIIKAEQILGNHLDSFIVASKSLKKTNFIKLEEIDSFFSKYLDQINILKQYLLKLEK